MTDFELYEGSALQGVDAKGRVAIPADFRATFAKLRTMTVDIFLNFHPQAMDFEDKAAKVRAGNALGFVDPGELGRRVDAAEAQFEKELAENGGGS